MSKRHFLCLIQIQSIQIRLAILACTRSNRRFCIPKIRKRSTDSRSAPNRFRDPTVLLSQYQAIRFLVWWLFLHRRLRSRQRGLPLESCKRLRILLAVPFQKMLSVFIQITQKSHLTFPSKPFGFDSRCYDNLNSASSIVLKQCVTALPAYPCIGQKPVSSFDCRSNLTPRFFFVKQKILQVLPLFYGLFSSSCGKLFLSPVENSVENF